MLFWYGIGLGASSLLRGQFRREVIKQLIVPVNYWRTLEYQLTFRELDARPGDRILDIGSPKLLSLYLADRIHADIYSTDIEEYFIHDYEQFRAVKKIPAERFHPLVVDGRKMQFSSASFDKVFSISVLEHIPDHGDSECMKEIARVLKEGGTCVLTVPFAPEGKNQYRESRDFYWSNSSKADESTGKTFYQRRYDEEDLQRRLIEASGLNLRRLLYLGERLEISPNKEVADYLPPVTGLLQPPLSKLLHTTSPDWRLLKKPLGALLVLQK